MRLFPYDAFVSLTRVFSPSESLRVVDVGANEGQTLRRVLEVFPNAHVACFEPAPQTFARLEACARELIVAKPNLAGKVRTFQLALGSSTGNVPFHVTKNHWCSSVLAPSDLGKRYYNEWYQTQDVIQVPITTLDAWSQAHAHLGFDQVDLLKVDAQGFDLEVLKGASGLLAQSVRAIQCEVMFVAEYARAASFSQIDQFLASRGFALHQLHEVQSRGSEEQTTYGDCLWLRVDVLEALRANPDLPDLSPLARVRRACTIARKAGASCVALYGSGRHTNAIAEHLALLPLPVHAIIDDNPDLRGTRLHAIDVISLDDVRTRGIDTIVLSSDAHEQAMWHRTSSLRAAGVRVLPLYTPALLEELKLRPADATHD